MFFYRSVVVLLLVLLSVHAVAGGPGRMSASAKGYQRKYDVPSPSPPRSTGHRFTPLSTDGLTSSGTNLSYFSVFDYGAVADGVTDNTAAFQNAINAVSAAGGGTLLCNRGHFLFKGSLNLLEGVTLEGTYSSAPSHPNKAAININTITGTVLMPTAGQGNASARSFITVLQDATVKGVVFYYPAQVGDQTPIPFPWTLDLVNNNAAVLDVETLNSFNFIRAVNAARHYIARVQGQPINIGIFIDSNYDIGRVENAHFNPWWSTTPAYLAWQLTYGRAFVIARSDWEYFFNTFALGYAIGYHFVESAVQGPLGGSCNGNFLGIGADAIQNASVRWTSRTHLAY